MYTTIQSNTQWVIDRHTKYVWSSTYDLLRHDKTILWTRMNLLILENNDIILIRSFVVSRCTYHMDIKGRWILNDFKELLNR